MSKQEKIAVEEKRREKEELRRINRIPDVEALFYDGEKKKNGKSRSFLSKLARKDWRQIVYATLIYILQVLPSWLMPLVTSDVIDLITNRPEGYITRIIIESVGLLCLLAMNIPMTMWRSSISNKLIRTTVAQVKEKI